MLIWYIFLIFYHSPESKDIEPVLIKPKFEGVATLNQID